MKTKIVLTSDTHDGFSTSSKFRIESMVKKIAEEKPDIILHAGDWAASKLKEIDNSMEIFRKYYKGPLVAVLGNHDFWTGKYYYDSIIPSSHTIEDVEKIHSHFFAKHKIDTSYINEEKKLLIVSYNGWYGHPEPPSNDAAWMPRDPNGWIHDVLREKANVAFFHMLNVLKDSKYDGWDKVVVTHFNITPCNYHARNDPQTSLRMSGNYNHFLELKEAGITHLAYGHTHQYENSITCGVKVLNSGSDYKKPKFLVFEVGEGEDSEWSGPLANL